MHPDSPVTDDSIRRAKEARDQERARIFQLTGVQVNDNGSVSLYDCSPQHLALVFGRRTVQMIRDGRDPYVAARLAGSFARQVVESQPKVIGYITASEPWGINR